MTILLGLYSLVSRFICRVKAAAVRIGLLRQAKAPFPVVSIGNLTLGGSEKTPLAMELLAHFLAAGRRPALVTRGYKGRWEREGGVLSDGRALRGGWEDAGDEPFMIARRFPAAGVFVGKRRSRSCLAAAEAGFDMAVFDDGFQHIKLARDVDIVLFDAAAKAPRREGASALRRADIILIKKGREATLSRFRREFPAAALFEYAVRSRGLRLFETGEAVATAALKGKRVLAFCGIARPERFFGLLEEIGLRPDSHVTYPDHFAYPAPALERMASECERSGIEALATTEKDAVKLFGRTWPLASTPLYILEIGLDLPSDFFNTLDSLLGPAFARPIPDRIKADCGS